MSVFDVWEDEVMAEPSQSFDLTTPEGFAALSKRVAHDATVMLLDRWDEWAGVSLDQLAEWATEDFRQQSVSLPKSAFGVGAQNAGREMQILLQNYRFLVRHSLAIVAQNSFGAPSARFPTGTLAAPTPLPSQHSSGQHRKRLP